MRQKTIQWSCLVLAALTLACISSGGASALPAGEAAPVFGIKQGEETVSLDELRGQVVLVSFWAST